MRVSNSTLALRLLLVNHLVSVPHMLPLIETALTVHSVEQSPLNSRRRVTHLTPLVYHLIIRIWLGKM